MTLKRRDEKNLYHLVNCVLLGCYAAGSGNFLPTSRDNLWAPILRFQESIISVLQRVFELGQDLRSLEQMGFFHLVTASKKTAVSV